MTSANSHQRHNKAESVYLFRAFSCTSKTRFSGRLYNNFLQWHISIQHISRKMGFNVWTIQSNLEWYEWYFI